MSSNQQGLQQGVSAKMQRDREQLQADAHKLEARKQELHGLRQLRVKSMDMAMAINSRGQSPELVAGAPQIIPTQELLLQKSQEIFAFYIMDGLLEQDGAK